MCEIELWRGGRVIDPLVVGRKKLSMISLPVAMLGEGTTPWLSISGGRLAMRDERKKVGGALRCLRR